MSTSMVMLNNLQTSVYKGQKGFLAIKIGEALGYKRPLDSIMHIFRKNETEFSEGTDYEVIRRTKKKKWPSNLIFTKSGLNLILMFSRMPLAAKFRKWLKDYIIFDNTKSPNFNDVMIDQLALIRQQLNVAERICRKGLSIDPPLADDDFHLVEDLPKTNDSETELLLPTALGKLFATHRSAQWVNKELEKIGLQEKVNHKWALTDAGKKHGVLIIRELKDGGLTKQIKWFPNVIKLIGQ